MNKSFKVLMATGVLICGTMGLIFTQSQSSAASSRKTSALQSGSNTSISTQRVVLAPAHKLHMVVTAYDQNQKISRQTYSYRLFRNGKVAKTGLVSNGHTTRVIKAKPGNYSLRVYRQQKQVSFSGGLSTSDQPHFV